MKSFELPIIVGKHCEPWAAVAFEPAPGSTFVVHRSNGATRGEWLVTHRGTTFISGHAPTRATALKMAAEMQIACPHASSVKAAQNASGQLEKLTGPHRKLRAEIKSFHGLER